MGKGTIYKEAMKEGGERKIATQTDADKTLNRRERRETRISRMNAN
jgi:hypothetical protein